MNPSSHPPFEFSFVTTNANISRFILRWFLSYFVFLKNEIDSQTSERNSSSGISSKSNKWSFSCIWSNFFRWESLGDLKNSWLGIQIMTWILEEESSESSWNFKDFGFEIEVSVRNAKSFKKQLIQNTRELRESEASFLFIDFYSYKGSK